MSIERKGTVWTTDENCCHWSNDVYMQFPIQKTGGECTKRAHETSKIQYKQGLQFIYVCEALLVL